MFKAIPSQRTSTLIKILLAIFVLLLPSCKTGQSLTNKEAQTFQLKKILFLPFKDMYVIYGNNAYFRCPLSGKVSIVGKVAEGANDFMTAKLISLFKSHKNYSLIPPERAENVLAKLLLKNKQELSDLDFLIQAGQALKADGVMLGRLYRFEKRIGKKYSIQSPASVSFDLLLIRVADSRILWSGKFDETQRSLSENLFQISAFLKRKGRWVTAEEMASSGLEDLLKIFFKS